MDGEGVFETLQAMLKGRRVGLESEFGPEPFFAPPPPDGAAESVEVYGIDNGLAFPFKHPDNWRCVPRPNPIANPDPRPPDISAQPP